MIFLASTTDKLQLVRSSAATIDSACHYVDAASSGLAPGGANRELHAFNTAATGDVLAAPASSTSRTLKQGTWRNKDAALECDVTVLYNDNGTTYEMHKVSLQPGDTLEYIEGVGFFTLTGSAPLDKEFFVTTDQTFATATTFADITQLTCPMKSGVLYKVHAALYHTNNASTTGSQFAFNIGATPTLASFGNISTVTDSVTAATVSAGVVTAVNTAMTAQTTGETATGLTIIEGTIQPSADGTFALRASSEVTVAAGLTVKAGSRMTVRQQR